MADDDVPCLIADIGGTNARFALVGRGGEAAGPLILRCADFPDLPSAVESYLARKRPGSRPRRGAFAVASPITGDRVSMTNHPWSFSISGVRQRLRFERLDVVNDFAAIALAIPELRADDRVQVGPGVPVADAPLVVLGPGTGLGVSALIPCGDGWVPLATEGGHASMAPATDREDEILALLRRRHEHVSAERVLSGLGLVNLYEAIAELTAAPAERLSPEDVTTRAQAGNDRVATAAFDMFCAMLGTVAGNLALTFGAHGGVFVAGGIVPRFTAAFAASGFRARFEEKGRFASYLAAIPTYVVTHDFPAFLGLARMAGAPPASRRAESC